MTLRREADVYVREPFDPEAPGDYATPDSAARAILDTVTGTKGDLFDPRYPGPLESYRELTRREVPDGAVTVLGHKSLEHCVELTVRIVPLGAYPGAAASYVVANFTATLSRPTVQYDPADRGALNDYFLVSRREQDGFSVLLVRHGRNKTDVEVWLRVMPVPAQRAYEFALDLDEALRRVGEVIFNERHPRTPNRTST